MLCLLKEQPEGNIRKIKAAASRLPLPSPLLSHLALCSGLQQHQMRWQHFLTFLCPRGDALKGELQKEVELQCKYHLQPCQSFCPPLLFFKHTCCFIQGSEAATQMEEQKNRTVRVW